MNGLISLTFITVAILKNVSGFGIAYQLHNGGFMKAVRKAEPKKQSILQLKISSKSKKHSSLNASNGHLDKTVISRRFILSRALSSTLIPTLLVSKSTSALAAEVGMSITTDEFEKILKDSYRSIQVVEFSGPKSETCVVKLIDGTTFSISDLIESSIDPRSPLKLQATCRGYNIPVKNLGLEEALLNTPKKKKVYMNSRVQEAALKEAAKKERLKLDEEERLKALFIMEEEETKKQLQKDAEEVEKRRLKEAEEAETKLKKEAEEAKKVTESREAE